jgi:GntR family transcriptional regulator, transcriptional repressor for pyruvate dehydrogenase complex
VFRLKRRKTSDILVDQIKQYITGHDLKPGDHLPTETELAKSFGVSRISVREATKTLGFLGILEAKPGRGLTVGRMDVGRLKESLSFHPAMYDVPDDQLVDTRVIIETGVVPYVIERMSADPAIYDRLNQLNDRLLNESDAGSHVKLDAAFHQLLVESSGLTPLAAFSDLLQIFFERFGKTVKKNWRGGVKVHQEIIDGLRDGKASAVIEILHRHIEAHKPGHAPGDAEPKGEGGRGKAEGGE